MTRYTTPNYGITYADDLEPLGNYPDLTAQVAATLDAALSRGGIAPPDVTDLASVAARVTSLEGSRTTDETTLGKLNTILTTRATVTGASQATAHLTPLALVWNTLQARSLAGMWAAGTANATATRIVVPTTGDYDLTVGVAWDVSATNQRTLGYRINGGAVTWIHSWNAPGGGFNGEQTAARRGIPMTAGQYLEVMAEQNTGGALNTGLVRATLSLGAL